MGTDSSVIEEQRLGRARMLPSVQGESHRPGNVSRDHYCDGKWIVVVKMVL